MVDMPTDLVVQGTPLQVLYSNYTSGRYVVNRRYQRKLVWTVEEKAKLIDSIVSQLPIPLVLLAETKPKQSSGDLEIIDGLQRLNAIFAFIENEYAVARGESEAGYFDLETLADTKALLDAGNLQQRTPVLNRDVCRAIANYQLPISTYRAATDEAVDEVFRRINSSGRQLSFQEVRQAGATSELAHAVRNISAEVRGDVSLTEYVPLTRMNEISINNRSLEYGIDVDQIFWVKEGVLEKDGIRQSRDEELILDLVLDLILIPKVATSGPRFRNAAYGLTSGVTQTSERTVEAAIRSLGPEELHRRFMGTLECIRQALEAAGTKFSPLVVTLERSRGVPRHFHALFVPICELLYLENLRPKSPKALGDALSGFWDKDLSLPGGGGDFTGDRKRELFDMVRARLKPVFSKKATEDAGATEAMGTLETLLNISLTEEGLFELKQGFTNIESSTFDENAFNKTLKTIVGMSNSGRKAKGYVIFGVADSEAAADRIAAKSKILARPYSRFFVTGTQHELADLGQSIDGMWRFLVDKISSSALESGFAVEVARNLRPIRYGNHLVWLLEAPVVDKPVTFDSTFYDRVGPTTVDVTGANVVNLVRRF